MSLWEREFGQSTKGRIVTLLRGGRRSVDELASDLGLTDNAVRAHLDTLQREQIVESVGVRKGDGAGKPAVLYGIARAAEPLFSRAYAPLLSALLVELCRRSTPAAVRRLLRSAGRRMAPPKSSGTLDARVSAAAALLNDLGGAAQVERNSDEFVIRGVGCPLSEAVAACPETCRAVEQLLTEVTGTRVIESCDRESAPNCRFRVPIPE